MSLIGLRPEYRALLKENAKLEGIIQGKDDFLQETLERIADLVGNSWSNFRYLNLRPHDALQLMKADILNINKPIQNIKQYAKRK